MADNEEQLWYNYVIGNAKDWYTMTNHIQKCCRSTLEYDDWQRTAKYRDAEECPVCGDNYWNKRSKCESHHHPLTLKTIIEDILYEHIENQTLDDQTGLNIVDQVMTKHTVGQVSYINLCVHCHKKFHADHPDVLDKIDEIFLERENDGRVAAELIKQEKLKKLKEAESLRKNEVISIVKEELEIPAAPEIEDKTEDIIPDIVDNSLAIDISKL